MKNLLFFISVAFTYFIFNLVFFYLIENKSFIEYSCLSSMGFFFGMIFLHNFYNNIAENY